MLAAPQLYAQWQTGTGVVYVTGQNVGVGTSTPTGELQVAGSFNAPSTGDASLLRINASAHPLAFGDIYALKFDPTFVRAASGTHSYFIGVNIQPPMITGSGAAVTNAVSLFVGGAPSGATNNYAVWVPSGTSELDGNVYLGISGNVGVGTTAPDSKFSVNGNGHIGGNLTVDGNVAAKYQDVAEWVDAASAVDDGSVVVLDTDRVNTVTASATAYDTHVAGVVSANPGIVLGEGGANRIKVATTGRVRVKVDATHAPIHIGDLLVTSAETGTAMKSQPVDVAGIEMHRPGTIIGKALEPLAGGTGKILVLLSLQ